MPAATTMRFSDAQREEVDSGCGLHERMARDSSVSPTPWGLWAAGTESWAVSRCPQLRGPSLPGRVATRPAHKEDAHSRARSGSCLLAAIGNSTILSRVLSGRV